MWLGCAISGRGGTRPHNALLAYLEVIDEAPDVVRRVLREAE